MKWCADLLSFIMLLGFLQFLIFKGETTGGFLHISAIAVHFFKFTAVVCKCSHYSLLMQPKSMQTACASVSVHVPRHTVYYIALCIHRVHYISICALCLLERSTCANLRLSACALICANVCGFSSLFFVF